MNLHSKFVYSNLKMVDDCVGKNASISNVMSMSLVYFDEGDETIKVRSFSGWIHTVFTLSEYEKKFVKLNETDNSFVVSLTNVIKSLSKIDCQLEIKINFNTKKISFKGKGFRVSLTGSLASSFIDPPDIPEDVEEIESPDTFADCLKQCIHTIHEKKNMGRMQFLGANIIPDHESGKMVIATSCADSSSICNDDENCYSIKEPLIIHKEICEKIIAMKDAGDFMFSVDSDKIYIQSTDILIVASHINDPVLPFDRVLSMANALNSKTILTNRAQLIQAIDFSSLYVSSSGQIKIILSDDGTMKVDGSDKDMGMFGQYDCFYSGDKQNISVAIEYNKFRESIKNIETSDVFISILFDKYKDGETPKYIKITPTASKINYLELMSLSYDF